ncbi:MAG: mechanosensitive ion channel [Candidatus Peribacteraceae bacterium]|nr:mechanosensitive ion channel [Candidatus Peribacteraceae bacterium]
MGEKELATMLFSILNENVLEIILHFIIVGVVLMLIKNLIEGVSSYIMFRLDNSICMGTRVQIGGYEGIVTKGNIFFISIKTEDGIAHVPTATWRKQGYKVFCNGGNCGEDE